MMKDFVSPYEKEQKSPDFPGFERKQDDEQSEFFAAARVKYIKGSLDDDIFIAQIASLETKHLKGQGVLVMEKTTFNFQDQMYVVLQYLEI